MKLQMGISREIRQIKCEMKEGIDMLVSFLNSFMSYFVVLAVVVIVAGVATAIGISMAKKKNADAADK